MTLSCRLVKALWWVGLSVTDLATFLAKSDGAVSGVIMMVGVLWVMGYAFCDANHWSLWLSLPAGCLVVLVLLMGCLVIAGVIVGTCLGIGWLIKWLWLKAGAWLERQNRACGGGS